MPVEGAPTTAKEMVDPEDCPNKDCPMRKAAAPVATPVVAPVVPTSEAVEFDLESIQVPEADEVEVTPEQVAATLREVLAAQVNESVRRALGAARGRLD